MKVKVLVTQLCPTLCTLMDCNPRGSSVYSPSKNTGVGCHFLLQGIFLTHVSCVSYIAGRVFTTEPPGKPQRLAKWIKHSKIQLFVIYRNLTTNTMI